MAYFIYIIFFLSGAAALIFETVWFRLSGLIFGNSVWSAALVLGGFMGGLALGNGLIARYGTRVKRPVNFYAGLELAIAITGMSLVLLLPLFESWLTPIFRPFLDTPWLLNPLRLSIAFLLIIVPTTAMGATLPILVKALYSVNRNFGLVLGRLYGWNTLGAVIGALAGEIALIKWLGIRGTGLIAVSLNLFAAYFALRIGAHAELQAVNITNMEKGLIKREHISLKGKRFLLAAFLSGGIMIALEVVWFRFLLLFCNGTTLVFAVMLSIVLMGIGMGGLIASWWYSFRPKPHYFLRTLTLLNGILTIITYIWFEKVFYQVQGQLAQIDSYLSTIAVALLALSLMLPVSVISGILFTMLGRAAKEEIRSGTRTAGMVTLTNTVGAMLGSFIAGFLLLPHLGMETSFFLLAAGYGVTAIVIPVMGRADGKGGMILSYVIITGFLLLMAFFPFGLMTDAYFSIINKKLEGAKRIAVREGLTETVFYYRYDIMGEPFYYRLITNGYSMSATITEAKRYMKLFVYLPVALHPDMKHALLISYGVGSTAKALTDTKSLDTIDIVDISKDILEMSSIVYPDPNKLPLNDERVNTHIEDGRFFLRTTKRRFDLITSEPPPPKLAGIVNLYSQEYFNLIYNRLSEGGIVSYWLPVHSLYEEDAKSIIKAFCNIFEDCSLWAGAGLEWMLIGTRYAIPHGSEELFARQWLDPIVGQELQKLGFEKPAQIGSLFIADSSDLKVLTENSLPLTDNFPLRLSIKSKLGKSFSPLFGTMMEENRAKQRFQHSDFINRMWPDTVLNESLQYFSYQRMIKNVLAPAFQQKGYYEWDDLYRVLTQTSLQTLPLWMMGTTHKEIEIANMQIGQEKYQSKAKPLLSIHTTAERNYSRAIQHIEVYLKTIPKMESLRIYPMYIFVLCMTGQNEKAEKVAQEIAPLLGADEGNMKYWKWMNTTFDLKSPYDNIH